MQVKVQFTLARSREPFPRTQTHLAEEPQPGALWNDCLEASVFRRPQIHMNLLKGIKGTWKTLVTSDLLSLLSLLLPQKIRSNAFQLPHERLPQHHDLETPYHGVVDVFYRTPGHRCSVRLLRCRRYLKLVANIGAGKLQHATGCSLTLSVCLAILSTCS